MMAPPADEPAQCFLESEQCGVRIPKLDDQRQRQPVRSTGMLDRRLPRLPPTHSIKTALYDACADGELPRVKTLVQDFNLLAKDVRLPLMAAANAGHSNVLRFLSSSYEEWAKKGFGFELAVDLGLAAAKTGCLELVDLALYGLKAEDKRRFGNTVFPAAVDREPLINHLLQKGLTITPACVATILNAAASRGTPSTFALLLQHCPTSSPDPLHLRGVYPLHAAACARRPAEERLPMMEYLVHTLHLDVNALDDGKLEPYAWGTPLHHAASWDQAARVEWLLQNGANPSVRNQFGRTPLEENGVGTVQRSKGRVIDLLVAALKGEETRK